MEKKMTDKKGKEDRWAHLDEGVARVAETGVTFEQAASAMQGLMAQWHQENHPHEEHR